MRLLTVPDAAPPFDGEVLPARAMTGLPAVVPPPGTALTADPPVSGMGGKAPRADAPLTGIGGETARADARLTGVSGAVPSHRRGTADTRTRGNAGPEPAADCDWTQQFARLLVETLAGARPLRQLLPWLSDRARVHLRRVEPVLRCGQRPRVLRVLASQPAGSVVEMSVIVGLGPRTRALAVRLEEAGRAGQPGRWLCTDIEAA